MEHAELKGVFGFRCAVVSGVVALVCAAGSLAFINLRHTSSAPDPWEPCPLGDDEYVATLSGADLKEARAYYDLDPAARFDVRQKTFESIGADFNKLRRAVSMSDSAVAARGDLSELVRQAGLVAVATFTDIEFSPAGAAGTFTVVDLLKGDAAEGQDVSVALDSDLIYSPYYPVPGCGLVLMDREILPVKQLGDKVLIMAVASDKERLTVAPWQTLPLRGLYGLEGEHVFATWLPVTDMHVSEFLADVRKAAAAAR